jgi:hypothetical protein
LTDIPASGNMMKQTKKSIIKNIIGRGNVLSDKTVSHLDVEKLLDEALRPLRRETLIRMRC